MAWTCSRHRLWICLAIILSACLLSIYLSSSFVISNGPSGYLFSAQASQGSLQYEADHVVSTPSYEQKADSKPDSKPSDPWYEYLVKTSNAEDSIYSTAACKIPILDPWDKTINQYYVGLKRDLSCSAEFRPPLAYIDNHEFIRLNLTASRLYYRPDLIYRCYAIYFYRLTDVKSRFDESVSIPVEEGLRIPEGVQFIFTYCGKKQKPFLKKIIGKRPHQGYWDIHYRYQVTPEVAEKIKKQREQPGNRKQLSVLLFMVDGVSHSAARRYLPKTYYYLLDKQAAIPINGHQTLGLNTFPNMVPYLTGHTSDELGHFRGPYDTYDWPFVWRNFTQHHYITGYAEDTAFSTFNYLKEGFVNQPTDVYLKNYLNVAENLRLTNFMCIRHRGMHMVMLNALNQFLQQHSGDNFFYWHFLNVLSHDNTYKVQFGDADYLKFFTEKYESGELNNTLLIFASDHGGRFGSLRTTPVGRLEEHMPLNLLVFPKWFRESKLELMRNVKRNSQLLTTHYDMYETLLDIAAGRDTDTADPVTGSSTPPRGISLFREIPATRTCVEAGVPESSCICRSVTTLPKDSVVSGMAANAGVDWINRYLSNHSDICMHLQLNEIHSSELSNTESIDAKSGKAYKSVIVAFTTEPGAAMFEAYVRLWTDGGRMEVTSGISRLNFYRKTSACVNDANMRNYCYCKSNIASSSQGH